MGTDAIFAETNVRAHTDGLVQRYLKNEILHIQWLLRSQDENLMEYMWEMFGRWIEDSVP